jgi:Flp pilus assembly pilin Flp
MRKFLKQLWKDDRGQSTTEYILILMVVVLVALKFKSKFDGTMTGALDKLDSKMNSAFSD